VRRATFVAGALIGAVLLIVFIVTGRAAAAIGASLNAARALGPAAPILLVLAETLAFTLLLPISPLHVGMGVLYGLAGGVPLAWASYSIGCMAPFVLVRRSPTVAEWFGRMRRNELIDGVLGALEHEPFKLIACLRLSPLLPSTVNSYALGLANVSLQKYAAASSVGCVPNLIAQVYIGSLFDSIAAAQQGAGAHGNSAATWALLIVGLGVTVGLVVYVSRMAMRRIDAARARAAADAPGRRSPEAAPAGPTSSSTGDAGSRWRGAPADLAEGPLLGPGADRDTV
jgi:uncharacterized membrane protein YdjX (TVP38/TMEM64 family)